MLFRSHISISNNKCNFFINDQFHLLNVVLPIFNYFTLNSSKRFQFEIFQIAVRLTINKFYLTAAGKAIFLNCYFDMKKPYVAVIENICITTQWLAGFISGDGSFSFTIKTGPRLKLENHIKELVLYQQIAVFLIKYLIIILLMLLLLI